LTPRAFEKSNIANEVVVAHDGAEAFDYLFATGSHVGRDARRIPTVVLLDLKLPKVDGLEALRRVRQAEQTRRLPVVILTSSCEERHLVESYGLGANSYYASQWILISLPKQLGSWACTGWC
jgi:two-component system response regulator